jgi:hypothetical protein
MKEEEDKVSEIDGYVSFVLLRMFCLTHSPRFAAAAVSQMAAPPAPAPLMNINSS